VASRRVDVKVVGVVGVVYSGAEAVRGAIPWWYLRVEASARSVSV